MVPVLGSIVVDLSVWTLSDDISERCLFPLGSFDEVIQVGNIGLMMFVMMIIKGLRGDNVRESIFGIGQLRKYETH